MKKIILSLVLIIILTIIYVEKGTEIIESKENLLLGDQQVEEIIIDADNVDLIISEGEIDEVQIKRKTTNTRFEQIEYSGSVNNGKVEISQYNKNGFDSKKDSKDLLEITIPLKSQLATFDINSKNSEININALTIEKLNINTKKTLKLDISKSKIDESTIISSIIDSEIDNTLLTDIISYNIDGGTIRESNTTGNLNQINNKEHIKYINENSFFLTTDFTSKVKSEINYAIDKNKNYQFNNVSSIPSNKILTENNQGYIYSGSQDVGIATINLNENKLNEISYEEKSESEQADEIVLQ